MSLKKTGRKIERNANLILYFNASFLAPPAERQRSFSNTDLSVVRLSVRLSVCPSRLRGGRGLSQKRFSNFSSFLAWSFFGVT